MVLGGCGWFQVVRVIPDGFGWFAVLVVTLKSLNKQIISVGKR